MTPDRDVAAFGERAVGYDRGWRGRMHHEIADRAGDLALAAVASPTRCSTWAAEFQSQRGQHVYAVIINAVTATKPV